MTEDKIYNQLVTLHKELSKINAKMELKYPVWYITGCDLDKCVQIIKENPVDGYKAFKMPDVRNGGFSHILFKETEQTTIWL